LYDTWCNDSRRFVFAPMCRGVTSKRSGNLQTDSRYEFQDKRLDSSIGKEITNKGSEIFSSNDQRYSLIIFLNFRFSIEQGSKSIDNEAKSVIIFFNINFSLIKISNRVVWILIYILKLCFASKNKWSEIILAWPISYESEEQSLDSIGSQK